MAIFKSVYRQLDSAARFGFAGSSHKIFLLAQFAAARRPHYGTNADSDFGFGAVAVGRAA